MSLTKQELMTALQALPEDDTAFPRIVKVYEEEMQRKATIENERNARAVREGWVPEKAKQGVFAKFLAESVLAAFLRFGVVCHIGRCGCGSLVRLVCDHDKMHAACPLCGCVYPYCFYKIKTDDGFIFDNADSLIIKLADDACDTCGESKGKPPCRCQRKRIVELNDQINALYQGIDTQKDSQAYETAQAAMKPLREELAQLNAICGN
jgi:hypothetical protein